jgi:uncharacterized membrane protein
MNWAARTRLEKTRFMAAIMVSVLSPIASLVVIESAGAQAAEPPVATSWEILRLGTLGGEFSEAHDINDSNQVVGIAGKPGIASHSGFLWKPTTSQMLELPAAPDPGRPSMVEGSSNPSSINNTGKIVGWSDRWIDLGQGVGQTIVATVWDVDTLIPTALALPGYVSAAR